MNANDDNSTGVIAIVFQFDKLFPNYEHTAESQLIVHPEGVRLMDSLSSVGVYDKSAPHGNSTIGTKNIDIDIDTYNNSIRLIDKIASDKTKKYVDLYLYTTHEIQLNSISPDNNNNTKLTKSTKAKIMAVLVHFKNIIYVSGENKEQYVIKNGTRQEIGGESPYHINDYKDYLNKIEAKYTKFFIYGDDPNSSSSNSNKFDNLSRMESAQENTPTQVSNLIAEEVTKIKYEYYYKSLQIAQKFKKDYDSEFKRFLLQIESIKDNKVYKKIYNLLKFIYINYKLHKSIIDSVPDGLKDNIKDDSKFVLLFPNSYTSSKNIYKIYTDYVEGWIKFLNTNIAVIINSYIPNNTINYPLVLLNKTLQQFINKIANDSYIKQLLNLAKIIKYIVFFYKYEIPGINPEYIYGYDSQKCSLHLKECGYLYITFSDEQKQKAKELHYAFVNFVTFDDFASSYDNSFTDNYATLVTYAPNGILESIYRKEPENIKQEIKGLLIDYITNHKDIVTTAVYTSNDEQYLLELTKNKSNINTLNVGQLYTLYKFLRRCAFLIYLESNSTTYRNLYDFAVSIPHDTPNPTRNLLDLWVKPFNNIFRIQYDKLYRFIEPCTPENITLLSALDANKEIVKMSSGSGAYRVEYTGIQPTKKKLFIKGYTHNGLFDPSNIYKRFAVSFLQDSDNKQLCISNTRIFNEIIMNYLMKKIVETDETLTLDDKNNIHTYEFIYTPDNDNIYIAQPVIGYKASIAGKVITTLKELLESYYNKLKSEIKSAQKKEEHVIPATQDMKHDLRQNISHALITVLPPYLDTLSKLRNTYRFVHTDLHFGNIFVKAKDPSPSPQPTVSDESIHNQLLSDLARCVLLIADYDLARLTIDPNTFDDPHIKQITLMHPGITYIDFKSIFIEDKAIEDTSQDINIVPKEQKKLQKKETVIRTRCEYDNYEYYYGSINDIHPHADILIYENWDILSIFINVIAFLKKCEYKIYGQESGIDGNFENIYNPIITLFAQYVINPVKNTVTNHHAVGTQLIHIFYACISRIYAHKKLKNRFRFLFEGKFSFITRVFEKFKSDYPVIVDNVEGYIKDDNATEVKVKSKLEWLSKLFAKSKKNPLLSDEVDAANQEVDGLSITLSESPTLKQRFGNMLTQFKKWITGLRTKKVKYVKLSTNSIKRTNSTNSTKMSRSNRVNISNISRGASEQPNTNRHISNVVLSKFSYSTWEENENLKFSVSMKADNSNDFYDISSDKFKELLNSVNMDVGFYREDDNSDTVFIYNQNGNNINPAEILKIKLSSLYTALMRLNTKPLSEPEQLELVGSEIRNTTLDFSAIQPIVTALQKESSFFMRPFIEPVLEQLTVATKSSSNKSLVVSQPIITPDRLMNLGIGNLICYLYVCMIYIYTYILNAKPETQHKLEIENTGSQALNIARIPSIKNGTQNKSDDKLYTSIFSILNQIIRKMGSSSDNGIIKYLPITLDAQGNKNSTKQLEDIKLTTEYSELLTLPEPYKPIRLTLFNIDGAKNIWKSALIYHFFKLNQHLDMYIVDTDKFDIALAEFNELYTNLQRIAKSDNVLNTLYSYYCNNESKDDTDINTVSAIIKGNDSVKTFISILKGLKGTSILSCSPPENSNNMFKSATQSSTPAPTQQSRRLTRRVSSTKFPSHRIRRESSKKRSIQEISTPERVYSMAKATSVKAELSKKANSYVNTVCPVSDDSNSVNDIKMQIVKNAFEKSTQPYRNNANQANKISCLKKMLSAKNTSKLNSRTKKLNLKGMEKIALREAIEEHASIKGANNIKYKLAKLGVLDALSKF